MGAALRGLQLAVTVTIPNFVGLNVVVAGDVMLDEYWFGDTGRISPEAPVPVVHVGEAEERPGGAANVALNLASLGVGTRLLGVVGDDERGRRLETLLTERGIVCGFHRAPDLPTIHKLRVLARSQQLIRLDAERPLAPAAANMSAGLPDILKGADALVLSDYGKGTLTDVAGLIAAARAAGVPCLVDPKGRDFSGYRGATLVTPNFAEFEAVVGPVADEADLAAKAAQLRTELALGGLLITRGERGMTLISDADPVTWPAEARQVFDVTGAGDTVIAVLGAGLAAGLSFAAAAQLANLAAGLVVRKIGAAAVTVSELKLALHQRGTGGRGAVSEEVLAAYVAEAKQRGERIVMTNGCFDILHAGHVAYLEEAKTLGDRLLVAVNDDPSVARLKGKQRPITPLADRLAVLAGLAAVDWVVPFSEDTPARLIETLLPDVLVKGGDYRPDEIAGAAAVQDHGGQVRVLGFREGRSTSTLIQRIRDQAQ
jgi:D-beta-D-heptose 7-phosphate kinase/D-beta-D-heptose 1-phosphate adenosyltransferase